MAIEAPAHVERSKLFHPLHLFHRPMATLTGYAGKNVLAMIEINKIRKIVNLGPLDGAQFLHGLLQFFDLYRLLLHQVVTVHAYAGRWDSGMAAGSRRIVAIQARNFVV